MVKVIEFYLCIYTLEENSWRGKNLIVVERGEVFKTKFKTLTEMKLVNDFCHLYKALN